MERSDRGPAGAAASWLSRASGLLAVIAMLLAVAPFIALARYAHPAYDDWCIAKAASTMGFWGAEQYWYNTWAGRFSAIALWNLVPISPRSIAGYRAFPPVFLAAFFVALFWLAYEVLAGRIPLRRVATYALAAFAVYLFAMASPAEGFYWYDGATVTTSGVVFALAAMAAAVRGQRAGSGVGAWVATLASAVFAFLAAGSNEIILQLLGLVLVVLIWLSRRHGRRGWYLLVVPLVIAAVGGIVDILAPGNYKRAAASGGLHGFLGPLAGSVASLGAALLDWLSRGPIILATLAIVAAGVAAAPSIPAGSSWRRTSWLIPAATAVLGVWGILFFTHWASGFAFKPGPPDRVLNVALVFFMLVSAVAAFMLGAQVVARQGQLAVVSQWSAARPWVILVVAAAMFGSGNVRQAYVDLLSGRAADYDAQLSRRHATMRAAGARHSSEVVTVPALTRIPKTILFKDITEDPDHPHNRCYAAFWDVSAVRVSP